MSSWNSQIEQGQASQIKQLQHEFRTETSQLGN
jgi:hypothetical protein